MSVDMTKPNISRIYDYVLGGHHNFEVDRLAAQSFLKTFPSYPVWARLNRWFLQMVAQEWGDTGQKYIIDLASGMPTQGHFHTAAPQAKVLYSDSDPITVAYAQEVIGDNPSVAYIQVDLRDPAPLLAAAEELFGGERKVAIGFIGFVYFLDDARVSHIARALHDWAAPGSVMALSYFYMNKSAAAQNIMEAGRRTLSLEGGALRNETELQALLAPWKMQKFDRLATWLGVENMVTDEDRGESDSDMYGMLLSHE